MLDLESFSYLTRALESPLAPLVILASNRGLTPIHTHSSSQSFPPDLPPTPHGIPQDLLARLLIVPTHAYTQNEILQIVRTRSRTEGLAVTDAALEKLAEVGARVSLRYALQMLAPAAILAKVKVGGIQATGGPKGEVGVEEVEECEGMFLDAGRSAKMGVNKAGFLG
jgi:RuvB-like protein 1 (pontin 52)